MNPNDYELARPGQKPLAITSIRESLAPDELMIRTDSDQHFPISKITYAVKRDDNVPRMRLRPKMEPSTVFEIRTGSPEASKELWTPVGETYTNLDEAKAALAFLKAASPNCVFALRKQTELLPDLDPREWAQRRVETGEWELVDWDFVNPDHIAHLSVGQIGSIAFYKTRRDALNDWCAIMPAAAYLKTYYGDILNTNQITQLVYKADPPGELVLSGSDGDAIMKVYRESGIYSCMEQRSAVKIYGAGDIQMASLVRNGRTIARALCWPERKFVGCIYGDTVRMKVALELHDYTRDYRGQSSAHTGGMGGFEGARLLKIRSGKGWLMPWIDLGYKVWDDGEFFRLSLHRGVCVNNTGNTYCGEIPYFPPEQELAA